MKKLIRRLILTMVILFGGCFVYTFGILWYTFYQEHRSAEIGRRNVEGARIIAERDAKIDAFAMILDQASKYEKEGKYDLAIEQYKKALDTHHDDWMAHCGLARAYEKSGQYELAIEEIDWIIAQNPRQQVKDEYIARKQRLEKLIKEANILPSQNPSNPQQSSTPSAKTL